jgi:hypothetical protein
LNVEPVRQAQGKLGTLKPASASALNERLFSSKNIQQKIRLSGIGHIGNMPEIL